MGTAEDLNNRWTGFVAPTPFKEYSEQFADFLAMTRRDGILEVRLHTDGGPYRHNWAAHTALNRAWSVIGEDPDNEVLILTGTGDRWFTANTGEVWATPLYEESPDYIYQQYFDAQKLVEKFVNAIDIPTISVINGPGIHAEFALLCDITLAAPDIDLMDPHFLVGSAPGDGMGLALQAVLGPKRAAYHMYLSDSITATDALELGLVNEVLPREDLHERAWEIAELIMKRPRFARRMTRAIANRPWRKAVSDDLGFHVTHQFLGMLGCRTPVPMRAESDEGAQRKAW